jgi:outer membrane receptor protein involved in Fe transport
MLPDEVVAASGKGMRTAGLFVALVSIATATACTAERALSPHAAPPPLATSVAPSSASQLPILFIVDGNRYFRDQLPPLSTEQVSAVQILKGHAALQKYGPDASYGVVLITTKLAARHT